MNIIFLDTETNGKPKNYRAHPSDIDNWPRITQIAYQICNEQGDLLLKFESIVKPDGWTVPKEQFFIENNMSTLRCELEGVPMPALLDALISNLHHFEVELMVCHNLGFDGPVLAAEITRYQKVVDRKMSKLCTMKESTEICKLPGQYGHKWPKLAELHQYLFECDFEGAHDASDDVTATRKCFFEMLSRGLIKLPIVA